MKSTSDGRATSAALSILSLPLLLASVAGATQSVAPSGDTALSVQERDALDLALFPNTERTSNGYETKERIPTDAIKKRELQSVLVDAQSEPGTVWVAGRSWKASFDTSGITYIPRFGRQAPRNYPTSLNLESVSRGGELIAFESGFVNSSNESVTLDRGSLQEVYHLDVDSVEQTFVFEDLPGAGDLVVSLKVDSALQVVPGDDQIRFVHEQFGEVQYGRAYALDATGDKIEIPRLWTGAGIEMTVPAEFLASAVLPVTIDPVIGNQFVNGYGFADDSRPDVAWEDTTGKYWFVWQDYVSATDSDAYVSSITSLGVQGNTLLVDITTEHWATPAIASSSANSSVLVVASVTSGGPGVGTGRIEGRMIDTTQELLGAVMVIDQSSFNCIHPDVGGSSNDLPVLADYCVVWQREVSATNSDIQVRGIHSTGTFMGNTEMVAGSSTEDDRAPVISKSRGNEAFANDFWNIAWIRDNTHSGRGTPFFRRYYYTATFGASTEQQAMVTELASNLDITSTFDNVVTGTNERPFVLVFDRAVGNGDIYAATCVQSGVLSTTNISLMEDFDRSLVSSRPSVATDGTSLIMVFEEEYWAGAADSDIYGLSANLAHSQGSAQVALSERHAVVDFALGDQQFATVSSRWDGRVSTDDAMIMWQDMASGSAITMAHFDSNTGDGSVYQAIGRQYCAANAHASSGSGGRRSSFIWAAGDASIGSLQRLTCDEMRLNSFAYFIVSDQTGNINFAGGGQGRLCLGGSIGRRVGGIIASTGNTGSIMASLDPAFLPAPNGMFSAAPGQTLYFQCWHRDAIGQLATSNFSNACAVTFLP